MLKLSALLVLVAAVIYTDRGADSLWFSALLPLLGLLAALVVFEIVGSAFIGFILLCYHFTDVQSDSLFYAIVCPFGIGAGIIALVCWAWSKGYLRGYGRGGWGAGGYGGWGDFGGGGGGGDGGGC